MPRPARRASAEQRLAELVHRTGLGRAAATFSAQSPRATSTPICRPARPSSAELPLARPAGSGSCRRRGGGCGRSNPRGGRGALAGGEARARPRAASPRRAMGAARRGCPRRAATRQPRGRLHDNGRMADVRIVEYTDPGCPWAYSAEPFRRRLNWLYGDRLEWRAVMVGLADSPDAYESRGFTPERQSSAFKHIAREHGMPIDTAQRPRMAATMPACRAVVAARLRAPEAERGLLRRLRVRHFSGQLLDDPATIDAAASDVGVDPEALRGWTGEPEVEEALRADVAAAREPMHAARVLDHKLANWSGGRRYTCPSYEVTRVADGVTIAVPGFQPFPVYDVLLANLVPGVDRREAPESVEEVLEWCGTPLATKEVAVVCDLPHPDARERLGRVAAEEHVGADGFWSLSA